MFKVLNELHIDKLITIGIVIVICTLILCVTGYKVADLYNCP